MATSGDAELQALLDEIQVNIHHASERSGEITPTILEGTPGALDEACRAAESANNAIYRAQSALDRLRARLGC